MLSAKACPGIFEGMSYAEKAKSQLRSQEAGESSPFRETTKNRTIVSIPRASPVNVDRSCYSVSSSVICRIALKGLFLNLQYDWYDEFCH